MCTTSNQKRETIIFKSALVINQYYYNRRQTALNPVYIIYLCTTRYVVNLFSVIGNDWDTLRSVHYYVYQHNFSQALNVAHVLRHVVPLIVFKY